MEKPTFWLNSLPPLPNTRTMTDALSVVGPAVVQRYTRLVIAPLTCDTVAASTAPGCSQGARQG